MHGSDILRAVATNFVAYKTKTFLAVLGVLIAVGATVGIVSIIEGYRFNVERQFEGMGANRIIVTPYRPPGVKGRLMSKVVLTTEDAAFLSDNATSISALSPILREPMIASYEAISYVTLVSGTDEHYAVINNHYVSSGRFLSRFDAASTAAVCVIGKDVAEKLDIPEPVLGREIVINRKVLTIVGILEERGELFGANMDDQILIPLRTMEAMAKKSSAESIIITAIAKSIDGMSSVEPQVRAILRRHHALEAGAPDDFRIIRQTDLVDTFNDAFTSLSLIIGGIVGISLLVGGIGIMNIMLTSVQERRKEIGIRMSVGARKVDILLQFLMEAVSICLFGGFLGLILGHVLGRILGNIPGFPAPHIPWWLMSLSLCFSCCIGVVFGILPAIRASNVNPIEAMRYE